MVALLLGYYYGARHTTGDTHCMQQSKQQSSNQNIYICYVTETYMGAAGDLTTMHPGTQRSTWREKHARTSLHIKQLK